MTRETLSKYDVKKWNVVRVTLRSSDGKEAVLEGTVRYASGVMAVADGPVEVEYEEPVDYEMQCAFMKNESAIVMFVSLVREPRSSFSGVIVVIEKTRRPGQWIGRYMIALFRIGLKIRKTYAGVKQRFSFSRDF